MDTLPKIVMYKSLLKKMIQIGISIWMLFFVLLYATLSDTVLFYVYLIAHATGTPWLETNFVQFREFILRFFTLSNLH